MVVSCSRPQSTNNSSINCYLWICYDPKWCTHRVPVVSVQTLIDGTQFLIRQHDRAYSSKGNKAIVELGFQMSTNMERTFLSHMYMYMYKLTSVNVVYCKVHTQERHTLSHSAGIESPVVVWDS